MSENQNVSTNLDKENSNQEPEVTVAPIKKTSSVRQGSKMAKLIEMLEAPDGTTIKQISEKLNWQNHTARGTLSRLRKNYNINIASDKSSGKNRTYKIA